MVDVAVVGIGAGGEGGGAATLRGRASYASRSAVPVDEHGAAKAALREAMGRRRLALSPAEGREASRAVCDHLLASPALAGARAVALFAAIRGEIDLEPLDAALRARSVAVAYPRVVDRRALAFHLVGERSELTPDRWGILTPAETAPLAEALDVIVVPGLAFDRAGHRIGYGRGYYDAALAARPAARRVGVAHTFQLTPERLPHHGGDEPLDLIITPAGPLATLARPHVSLEALT